MIEVCGMQKLLIKALKNIGDQSRIIEYRRVPGGDINESYYVRSQKHTYFIKCKKHPPQKFFQLEALGLEKIRKTNSIATPQIYGIGERDGYGYLMMEWIHGKKTGQTGEWLGRGLAEMHKHKGPGFGFQEDNYIGLLPQKNSYISSWIDYYREFRIEPQITLAVQKELLPTSTQKKLDKLLTHLDQWLPKDCIPSLLHGDLWGGNWLPGYNGKPYLIDPAIFYGHHEFEIAFTELFGGFPSNFYESYQEVFPLSPNYEERKALYQLFYLLVHLNLFGISYLSSIENIVTRYVG